MGLCRFGFLDNVLSRPLLRGYIIAIAVTIVIEQIDTLFGFNLSGLEALETLKAEAYHGIQKIPHVIEHMSEASGLSLGIGLSSLAFLLILTILKKNTIGKPRMRWLIYFPDILLVVVIGIVVTSTAKLDKQGLAVLGKYKGGFRAPHLPL